MEISSATVALSALGQTTRLSIFRLLVEAGPDGRMVGEIAQALALPGATLSFHLKELGAAGLVQGEPRGRYICYRANFEAITALIEFLTHDCCGGDASRCAPGKRVPAARTAASARSRTVRA
ncbi:MAG: transcriptional regulator [Lysobacteraceae bacterium]|nr:MAG: transcriptional regulator [Xanthomonadaceae bacterium]